MHYAAIVVGGSYAGLSAATYLARARWSLCVIDAGLPRNRFSPAAHGFFGQDGAAPGDMIAQARAQLERYPAAALRHAAVQAARAADQGFALTLDTGEELSCANWSSPSGSLTSCRTCLVWRRGGARPCSTARTAMDTSSADANSASSRPGRWRRIRHG